MRSQVLRVSAYAALLVAFLIPLANVLDAQQAKTKKDKKKDAPAKDSKEAMDLLRLQEANVLKYAFTLLALAKDDYGPNKRVAMKEVAKAVDQLDKDAMKPLRKKIEEISKANNQLHKQLSAIGFVLDKAEMQAISDSQVRTAIVLLTGVGDTMTVKNQTKPLEHVQKASNELQGVVLQKAAANMKGREAKVLTSAYILLASANEPFGGHRENAMKKLREAINQLDPNALGQEGVKQQIKTLKQANSQFAKAAQPVPEGSENVAPVQSVGATLNVLSDAQMFMANATIQRMALYLSNQKQASVAAKLLVEASNEIGLALSGI